MFLFYSIAFYSAALSFTLFILNLFSSDRAHWGRIRVNISRRHRLFCRRLPNEPEAHQLEGAIGEQKAELIFRSEEIASAQSQTQASRAAGAKSITYSTHSPSAKYITLHNVSIDFQLDASLPTISGDQKIPFKILAGRSVCLGAGPITRSIFRHPSI